MGCPQDVFSSNSTCVPSSGLSGPVFPAFLCYFFYFKTFLVCSSVRSLLALVPVRRCSWWGALLPPYCHPFLHIPLVSSSHLERSQLLLVSRPSDCLRHLVSPLGSGVGNGVVSAALVGVKWVCLPWPSVHPGIAATSSSWGCTPISPGNPICEEGWDTSHVAPLIPVLGA